MASHVRCVCVCVQFLPLEGYIEDVSASNVRIVLAAAACLLAVASHFLVPFPQQRLTLGACVVRNTSIHSTEAHTHAHMDGWMDGWMDGCFPSPMCLVCVFRLCTLL